ncbi:MAG: MarR family winged helix-turn-helix transcriptional regulator [Bacteroidetes bacterium]|nr:MarR family winged helix-turn-helix transcriptional regulator [Bacteroidota bacterium]
MSDQKDVFSYQKAEESSGFLLWQVTNLWQREIRKTLEPFGLTHSQFVLMASIHWLSLHQQDVTQILLSGHTRIDPMTTSTVLRSLQAKGLVIRTEHPVDTRAKTVGLTEEGIRITRLAVVAVEKFDREFFSVLEPELENFHSGIKQLMKGRGG